LISEHGLNIQIFLELDLVGYFILSIQSKIQEKFVFLMLVLTRLAKFKAKKLKKIIFFFHNQPGTEKVRKKIDKAGLTSL
jgi:hypothetical protein